MFQNRHQMTSPKYELDYPGDSFCAKRRGGISPPRPIAFDETVRIFRVWHQFLAIPRDDRYPGYAPRQYSSLVADVEARDSVEAQAAVEKMYGGWSRCRVFYTSRLDESCFSDKALKLKISNNALLSCKLE